MENIEQRVKKIVAEQLGVNEAEVKIDSSFVDDLGADYVSAPGQVRTLTLADQSEVTLGADSAIAVNFSGNERHVELRRGVAFFHVTHTGQPFVVDADGGEARVLGTEFEVRLQPRGAQVTDIAVLVVAADDLADRFTTVMPRDYARVVAAREEAEEAGLDEEATTAMMMEAAHG